MATNLAITSTDAAPVRRSKPTPNDVAEFKEHVRLTGQPEIFRWITTTKAFDLSDAEILAEFQINRKKRPEMDEAPCPICSPNAPKYLAGYLVWFPHEYVVRAIGKECGRRINEHWEKEVHAHRLREQEKRRDEFIESELKNVPELIFLMNRELERSLAQKEVWNKFKKSCPAIVSHLRQCMAHGVLTVSRKRTEISGTSMTSQSGPSNYFEEKLGSVAGQSAVKSEFKHDKILKEQLENLKAINHGSDKELTFLALCDMDTRSKKAVEKVIKDARKNLKKYQGIGDDFDLFFERGNIDLITKWANDQSSSFQFTLALTSNSMRLKVFSDEFGFESIDLTSLRR